MQVVLVTLSYFFKKDGCRPVNLFFSEIAFTSQFSCFKKLLTCLQKRLAAIKNDLILRGKKKRAAGRLRCKISVNYLK